MRFVEPSCEVVSITVRYDENTETIVGGGEEVIERMGRICYKSEEKIATGTAAKLINTLIGVEHFAVLEHASVGVVFVCDRGVSHELVRHRIAAYCQESTRYCNYGKDKFGKEVVFVLPSNFSLWSEEQAAVFMKSCEMAEVGYLKLTDSGIKPQFARSILPNCTKTEVGATFDITQWINVFNKRLFNPKAHPDMRLMMRLAYPKLRKLYPDVFTRELPND